MAAIKQASKSIHVIKVINWNENPIKVNPNTRPYSKWIIGFVHLRMAYQLCDRVDVVVAIVFVLCVPSSAHSEYALPWMDMHTDITWMRQNMYIAIGARNVIN